VGQESLGTTALNHQTIRRKSSLCVCMNVCVYTWMHVFMSLLWVRVGGEEVKACTNVRKMTYYENYDVQKIM
jgi:hypothetical protein